MRKTRMSKKYQYECTVRLETAWWFPVKKAANKEEFIKQITKEFSDDGFDIKRSDICHINTDNPNEKNEDE